MRPVENVNTMAKKKEKEHSHMIAMARLVVKQLYSVQKTLQYGKKRVRKYFQLCKEVAAGSKASHTRRRFVSTWN